MGTFDAIDPEDAIYDAPGRAVLGLLLALTTICVGGRAIARYLKPCKLGADDVLAYIAYLVNTGMLICGFIAIDLGYLNMPATLAITPADLDFMSKTLTALGVFYLVVLIPIKLSILFLHRRIFTLSSGWVRWYWWFNFLFVFPCWTVLTFTLFGLVFDPLTSPKRLAPVVTPLVGSTNALSDLLILVLPISCIRGLKMARRTRYSLYAIFSLALVASGVSILRMALIISRHGVTSPNFTKENFTDLCTTATETSVGLMCVCLPVIKPFLRKMNEYTTRGYSEISVLLKRSLNDTPKASGTHSVHSGRDGTSSFTRLRYGQAQTAEDYKIDSISLSEHSYRRHASDSAIEPEQHAHN